MESQTIQMTVIYHTLSNDYEQKGTSALVGPSRMSYRKGNKTPPLVEYIAANLAKLYKDNE